MMIDREIYDSQGYGPMEDRTLEKRLMEAGYILDEGVYRRQVGPLILCFWFTDEAIKLDVLGVTPSAGNKDLYSLSFSLGFYADPVDMFEQAILVMHQTLLGVLPEGSNG